MGLPMLRTRFRGAVALICSAAVGLAACTDRASVRFDLSMAEIGDVRDVVPATGTLKAESQVAVASELPGRIIEVAVQPNDAVRRGDVLARIKPDRMQLDLDAARAEGVASRAAVVEARARTAQVERHLANQEKLAQGGFISPAALDQAKADVDAARAAVARTEAEAHRAAIAVRAAEQGLAEVVIRAPIDGVVLSRAAEPGQLVSPSSETPLFVMVSDTRTMLIETMVSEADIARVNADVGVVFTVEAHPGRTFRGTIRRILMSPVQDRKFVSYPVVIEVDNPEGLLLPGMTAAVEFVHADARQVLRIPVEALYHVPEGYVPSLSAELAAALKRRGLDNLDGMIGAELGTILASGRQRVFIVEGDRVLSRAVKIGAESRDHVEVVDGLQPGTRVIVGAARHEVGEGR
ncbi:MAG: efflux RND transporter periplasmic adaptor subunit [Caulobacteraceae bacterium]|nr:efflux RND transporter periplasmic adaptor subunit [Caulobacteraceae bacterium]